MTVPLGYWIRSVTACLVLAVLVGCRDAYRDVPLPELERRQPFNAVVERIYIDDSPRDGLGVIIGLKTEDGNRICLSGERADRGFLRFARSLKEGDRYEFPKVWLDFRQRSGAK
jgi:hypothetical protein